MIIMSVDLGKARTGIAVSDPSGAFAFPKEVITEYNTERLIEKVCAKAKELSAERIVVGYPKNMDGTLGERAQKRGLPDPGRRVDQDPRAEGKGGEKLYRLCDVHGNVVRLHIDKILSRGAVHHVDEAICTEGVFAVVGML